MRIWMLVSMLSLSLPAVAVEAQDYKVGIVGLRHGHVFGNLPRLLETEGVSVVGVAEELTVQHPHLKKMAPHLPLFTSVDQLLSEEKPDIVWAFVENNRHLEIVRMCAPLGIHVIFEKPLAATLKDAREIRRVAQQHQIHVLTNYQMVWWPTTQAAIRAAKAGTIGEVWRVHGIVGHGGPAGGNSMHQDFGRNRVAVFLEWLDDAEKNGGGAIMDFGCYGAAWALQYLGKPQSVLAATNLRKPEIYKVDDNAVILCHYDRGVAILEGSWSLPRSFQDVEVYGTKGAITATRKLATLTPKGSNVESRQLEAPELPLDQSSVVAYLAGCLRKGKTPEGMTTLDLNVDVMEILEAAKQSVRTGQAVALPLGD